MAGLPQDADMGRCCGKGCREICQQRWLTQFGLPTAMLSVIQLSLPHTNRLRAIKSTKGLDHPGSQIAKISGIRGKRTGTTTDMGHTRSLLWSKTSQPQAVARSRSSTIRRSSHGTRGSGRKSGTTRRSRSPVRTGVSKLCWISLTVFTLLQEESLLGTRPGIAAG